MRERVVDVTLRFAHDVSLGAWFGGAWMGAVGLNSATMEVDDHTQRTRVANAGWFRWAPVVGLSVVVHTACAAALGRLSVPTGRRWSLLQVVRTAMTGLAVLATIETGVSGRRVVQAGDVPVATAVVPISSPPPEVAAAQRRLRIAQWLVPAFTACLWVIDAVQEG